MIAKHCMWSMSVHYLSVVGRSDTKTTKVSVTFESWILADSLCRFFASSMFKCNVHFSQYSENKKKEGSIIRKEMQHIAVKIFEIKFDFKYEHFSEPNLVIEFIRLQKIVQSKGAKLTDQPIYGLKFFTYLHWGQGNVFLYMIMFTKYFNFNGNSSSEKGVLRFACVQVCKSFLFQMYCFYT